MADLQDNTKLKAGSNQVVTLSEAQAMSLEWRIEQMRRVRTFMAKADYDRVMEELSKLKGE